MRKTRSSDREILSLTKPKVNDAKSNGNIIKTKTRKNEKSNTNHYKNKHLNNKDNSRKRKLSDRSSDKNKSTKSKEVKSGDDGRIDISFSDVCKCRKPPLSKFKQKCKLF